MVSRLALAWLCISWPAATLATQAGIEATVDRTQVALGETITLTVTVANANAQPSLPPMPEFDARALGTSTQMQFINGVQSRQLQLQYELTPKKVGTFTIGRATLTVNGRRYQTEPIVVKVGKAAQVTTPNDRMFLQASVSNKNPYVGEQIIYTMRFYRRVRITEANASLSDFAGFLVEDLGNQRDFRTVIQGREYMVTEIRKLLFPQRAGELTIEAPALNLRVPTDTGHADAFGDFFGRRATTRERLDGNAVELSVQRLPEGAPSHFSGLVGVFDIDASLSKPDLSVGESTTLTIRVSGTGNAQQISEPSFEHTEMFKIYDDKPEEKLGLNGEIYQGIKVFRKALVPTQAGTLSMGPLRLTYFDPQEKRYVTKSAGPFIMKIAPGAQKEELRLTETIQAPPVQLPVEVREDELLPLLSGIEALQRPLLHRHPLAFWVLLLLPPFAFFGMTLMQRYCQDDGSSPTQRRRGAYKKFSRRLASLNGADAATLYCALREYIGDRMNVEGRALTPEDAINLLQTRGARADTISQMERLMRDLEVAQYGNAQGHIDPGTARTLVDALERQL